MPEAITLHLASCILLIALSLLYWRERRRAKAGIRERTPLMQTATSAATLGLVIVHSLLFLATRGLWHAVLGALWLFVLLIGLFVRR